MAKLGKSKGGMGLATTSGWTGLYKTPGAAIRALKSELKAARKRAVRMEKEFNRLESDMWALANSMPWLYMTDDLDSIDCAIEELELTMGTTTPPRRRPVVRGKKCKKGKCGGRRGGR